MNSPSSYPAPSRLVLPVEPYVVTGRKFGQRVRSRLILWARHLGDDVVLDPGTPIHAIGSGTVVWSEVRRGSKDHRNWGGIVVVGHQDPHTNSTFFSLYGHMRDLAAREGDNVSSGQQLGVVAEGKTPENGWWLTPHVHFGIYTGPWLNHILPGYARPFEGRTKFSWWQDPQPFIEAYNSHTIAGRDEEGQG